MKKKKIKNKNSEVKYCKKCGCELPSNSKINSCDQCRRESAKKFREGAATVGTLALAVVAVVPGAKHITKFIKK
ncbi:hypothetical protein [Chakrabartyella piscis]|uniref:hypothetical protein n=1 Tax=Chakrabartyella piscis TaxID=2918914 RepID=UPI00295860DA|nr:hypothetical protein [Chakrabartyella piscis]